MCFAEQQDLFSRLGESLIGLPLLFSHDGRMHPPNLGD